MDFLGGDISVREISQYAVGALGGDDTLQFFPSLCSIAQITTASHCKQSALKTSLISSPSQMSACNDKILKDTPSFLILF